MKEDVEKLRRNLGIPLGKFPGEGGVHTRAKTPSSRSGRHDVDHSFLPLWDNWRICRPRFTSASRVESIQVSEACFVACGLPGQVPFSHTQVNMGKGTGARKSPHRMPKTFFLLPKRVLLQSFNPILSDPSLSVYTQENSNPISHSQIIHFHTRPHINTPLPSPRPSFWQHLQAPYRHHNLPHSLHSSSRSY